MIPERLRLYNFMCYRNEQSLDFSGMHLACLAGDNGHGKSALLDAITWALWGRARSSRDDDLISLGENEMWVEFEFSLGPQRYRVWRQRSKRGRGQTALHFYVWNEQGGAWQPLDEGGVRERQAQIVRLLRMDYETFVNSAFLLQGKADSFTLKTASERKQILADILGLDRYALYEQRAREMAQALKEQAAQVQADIRWIEAELARRQEYEAQLATAQRAVAEAVERLRAAELEQARVREVVMGLRSQAQQLADLRRRLERSQAELGDLQRQLAAAEKRVEQFMAVLAQRDEIEAGWAALEQARQEDEQWNARLRRHTQLQEQLASLQRAVDQARASLEAEQRRLADRYAELGRKIALSQEQAGELEEVRAILQYLDARHARREVIEGELRGLEARLAGLKAEHKRVEADGRLASEKIAALREAATCPLCGQGLTPAHRDQVLEELAGERDALAERYLTLSAEIKALTEQRAALEQEKIGLEQELRLRDARQRRLAQLETSLAEGQAAAAEQSRLATEMAEVARRLADQDYAPDERGRLAHLQAQLDAIGYDPAAHARVRAEVDRLRPFDARYQRELLPALDGIEDARARVEALRGQLDRRIAEVAADQAAADQLARAVEELPRLEEALARADAAVSEAAQAEREARRREGAALQQLSALDALVERRAGLYKRLNALNTEIGIYHELQEAFSKRGLQAMIIESAIPEIETEANILLARMTEGRMSVRLETQREKVTGGMAETLDIILADELGPRPYELFSGGEAFRANLALRIAISKLLARRAGAQLQTLVIDEGFGSQDTRGRQLVVEAINSIQRDFERILVITHIEELKDLFPARIDVVKTAEGSRILIAG